MRTDYADEKHRGWMRDLLQRAAAHFGLVLIGEPTFGWNDRSIGTAAEGPAGTRWLRVVTEHLTWTDNDFWTRNADSAVIPGVAKPLLLDFVEYDERGQRIRAEVMTLASGQVCSPTQDLRDELALPPTWWAELRRSLGLLATVPTRR